MTKAAKEQAGSIHVQWVRSGIGFTRRQKNMVRSLGLRRLRHIVELPDTPSVRGLVARIPHMVRIVEVMPLPGWRSLPEYVVKKSTGEPAPSPGGNDSGEAEGGVLTPPEAGS